MNRKEFLQKVGFGAAIALVPICAGGLATSCSDEESKVAAPTNVNFTIDVSSGALATNGGFLVMKGIIIAKTLAGRFIAVAAACTHQGTTVNYVSTDNNFVCPNHQAHFDSSGVVTKGPAAVNLTSYQTKLNGNMLNIYS